MWRRRLLLPLAALVATLAAQEAGMDANWLDAAPGVAMEYKVHVDAGKVLKK